MQGVAADQKLNPRDALAELLDILRRVAESGSPQRLSAVRYMLCREALLSSDRRHELPGFLHQCVSIYKFHDFINLYHPQHRARIEFVEQALGACAAALERKPGFDVFGSDF